MREPPIHRYSALAVVFTLTLIGFHTAIAQQAPNATLRIDAAHCPEGSEEIAYKTLVTFVPWMLARKERIAALDDKARQAMFREFAEKHLWRTGMPAGDGSEG